MFKAFSDSPRSADEMEAVEKVYLPSIVNFAKESFGSFLVSSAYGHNFHVTLELTYSHEICLQNLISHFSEQVSVLDSRASEAIESLNVVLSYLKHSCSSAEVRPDLGVTMVIPVSTACALLELIIIKVFQNNAILLKEGCIEEYTSFEKLLTSSRDSYYLIDFFDLIKKEIDTYFSNPEKERRLL